jgi:hypothetical protein
MTTTGLPLRDALENYLLLRRALGLSRYCPLEGRRRDVLSSPKPI